MLATIYDVANEALAAATGDVRGHDFLFSTRSPANVRIGNDLLEVHCECGWIMTVHQYQTRQAWEEHVSAAVAGC